MTTNPHTMVQLIAQANDAATRIQRAHRGRFGLQTPAHAPNSPVAAPDRSLSPTTIAASLSVA